MKKIEEMLVKTINLYNTPPIRPKSAKNERLKTTSSFNKISKA